MLNITANETQSLIQPLSCYNPKAAKLVAYCLIFVVSLAGNIFIGIIVYKARTMRKPINFLIVNMAMSDLLFTIFLFPRLVTGLLVDSWLISGPLGEALCKLNPFAFDVSLTVSIQSLVLITVNRFGAVVFPLRSPFISSKFCPLFIFATWIIAMALHSPYLFAYKLVEQPGKLACELRWNEVFGESFTFDHYLVAISAVFSFISLVFIAILYLIIYVKLKSQKIPGEQSANARQQRVKRERNVSKMAIAIVLGFAVCYVPHSIFIILGPFASDIPFWTSCSFNYVWNIANFLAQVNCAVNPCICFIFSGNFRESLKNLLSCSSVRQANQDTT